VLAYLFWHRPAESTDVAAYERALGAFHRSLARTPPVGLHGSACFRLAELPWVAPAGDDSQAGYEDWYLVEDHAALGVLNEAAVGRGHRTSHDQAARLFGVGAGGLYGLLEGDLPSLGEASLAIWVSRPAGSRQQGLGELLGDGMDPRHASLWRRQLVLGPAPEFCLLAREVPPGAAATRLPNGWAARSLERETLWSA
jgi:hypothetical protein